ncbi:MAG: 50S ribosomal protein L17 [Candidatus Omnitrophica bacterium]|nr:50S ribosomal protein L17 [Candidatus Omnitrophota bacterium]
MRHKRNIQKLGRNKSQRKSLIKNLAISFFQNKKITTTEARAKHLRRIVERLITIAKSQDLTSIRRINKFLNQPSTTKIVKDMGLRYRERNGGYTQIIKKGNRKGDAGETVILQLTT